MIVMISLGWKATEEMMSSWEDFQSQRVCEWDKDSNREQSNEFQTLELDMPWSVDVLNKTDTLKPSFDIIEVIDNGIEWLGDIVGNIEGNCEVDIEVGV